MISPRASIPIALRPVVAVAEHIVGHPLPVARILAHSPRAAVVSALLELGIERAARPLTTRTAGIVRIVASFAVYCPFCIDMNAAAYRTARLSHAEVAALRSGETDLFAARERTLIAYVRALCETPLAVSSEVIADVERAYGARRAVAIAALTAKVNYWARLIQGLGIPPLGLLAQCDLPPGIIDRTP